MTLSKLMELVSQAENEGVTLAEVISRSMTSEQMDIACVEIAEQLSNNYANIEDFMGDIEIPSLEEIAEFEEEFIPQTA